MANILHSSNSVESSLKSIDKVLGVGRILALDGDLAVVLSHEELGKEEHAVASTEEVELHDLALEAGGNNVNVMTSTSTLDLRRLRRRGVDLELLLVGSIEGGPLLLEDSSVDGGAGIESESSGSHHVHTSVGVVVILANEHVVIIDVVALLVLLIGLILLLSSSVAEIRNNELLGSNEVSSGLLIDDREGVELVEEGLDERILHINELIDVVLSGINDSTSTLDVVLEESVVHHDTITKIGRRLILNEGLEETAEHGLHLRSTSEEELDGAGEELQANVDGLLVDDAIDDNLNNVGSIRHKVGEGANEPEASSTTVGVGELGEEVGDGVHDFLSILGMLTEDVLEDDDGLRADVLDLNIEEVEESIEDISGGNLHVGAEVGNGTNGLTSSRLGGTGDVLLELIEDVLVVGLGRQERKDLNLLVVDAGRLRVAAEELAVLVDEGLVVATHHELDVAEDSVGDFVGRIGHQSEERLLETVVDLLLDLGHVLGEGEVGLGGGEDDSRVVVTKEGLDEVHDAKELILALGAVLGDEVEDGADGPLVEVLQTVEKVVDEVLGLGEIAGDLLEGKKSVGDNEGISVENEVLEGGDEVAVLDELLIEVVELEDAHDGGSTDVGALVLEATLERGLHVLDDGAETKGAEGTDSHTTNGRILVAARDGGEGGGDTCPYRRC